MYIVNTNCSVYRKTEMFGPRVLRVKFLNIHGGLDLAETNSFL